MAHRYWGYDSRVVHIVTGTEDMTHRYWGYDSRIMHIVTGTEDMTHRYWGYDSRVMNILTGTAYSLYRVCRQTISKCKNTASVDLWLFFATKVQRWSSKVQHTTSVFLTINDRIWASHTICMCKTFETFVKKWLFALYILPFLICHIWQD